MRAGIEPNKLSVAQGGRRKRINLGISRRELEDINMGLIEGDIECASDASVRGKVVVCIRRKYTEDGIMLTIEVRGKPFDSGRAELAGPLMALTVLKEIEEEFGTVGITVLLCESKEIVGECKDEKLRLLPSRSFSPKADLVLEKEKLKGEYGGSLEMKKVQAH